MGDDRPYWDPEVEAMPREAWPSYQDRLVREAVAFAYDHAPEVLRRMQRAGVMPDDIRGVADLPRIPILAKDALPELQAKHPPFGGMLAVEVSQLRRIFMSPGPIFEPEGDRRDYWRWAPALWAAGFRPGDLVQNTFAYHLTPAGAMMEEGLRAIGCVVVPGGVGNTEWQVTMMAQMQVTGYVGTPSFLLTLLQRAQEKGLALSVQRAFVTGEPLPEPLRRTLQEDYGVDVYQGYGTADVGNIAYECSEKAGWHIAPGIVVEIVNPATGEPVPPGEPGEVVITRPDAVYPLVRFGTGDLSALNVVPCPCGRTSPRLVGFLGRVGEGVKVRGMFVHPRQLAQVFSGRSEVARYQGVVTRVGHQDEFTVRVEPKPGARVHPDELAAALREVIKLRVNVEVVAPGTLPEDAKPLVDRRTWE
ncbi:phenylacetate--CoA ligase family protein [Thermoflexus sp.]|uniref:phenylacetate--CoA ligase family protein n=1 Tax=Thermoflexus sp. TaxID=1969742 RepID=UPI0035E44EA2